MTVFQSAVAAGSFGGGLLVDHAGIPSAFLFGGCLSLACALLLMRSDRLASWPLADSPTPPIRQPVKANSFKLRSPQECMVRRTTAREKLWNEKTSLRKCMRPLVEIVSPGHDELRACPSL